MWSTGFLSNLTFAAIVSFPLLLVGTIWFCAWLYNTYIRHESIRPAPITTKKQFPQSTKEFLINTVHEHTQASLGLSKRALEESEYDIQNAFDLLKATQFSKKTRAYEHGLVKGYNYLDKAAVLVEVNCEYDFTVKSQEFKLFVEDLCVHIATTKPKTIYKDYVGNTFDPLSSIPPPAVLNDVALMDQIMSVPGYDDKTVREVVEDLSARLGDTIIIRRFKLYQLAENIRIK